MDPLFTIKIFTLNCWGIVFVSKDRRARMYAIAKHLSRCNLDFVCLQEVWSQQDYEFLSKKASQSLPFSHYFNSGVNGPGLCVLSRHPIIDVYFHQSPINGYAHKIHQGDWFGGKGVGLCRIKMNDKIIHLYNTHLHAEYDIVRLQYLDHRVLQAFDASQFIKLTSRDCDLAILAGDLNSEPQDPAIAILQNNAQLVDCFTVAQSKNSGCIGTNESFRNSYAPLKELKRQPEGKRIDYVMFNKPSQFNVNVLEYLFPLPDRVPGCQFSYSDHEAVEVVLQCFPSKGDNCGGGEFDSVDGKESARKLESVLSNAVSILNKSLSTLVKSRRQYYVWSIILGLLLLLSVFVELFFHIPNDIASQTTFIIFFNLFKILLTVTFLFSILMGSLWTSIEQSALLAGKHSMMILMQTLSEVKNEIS